MGHSGFVSRTNARRRNKIKHLKMGLCKDCSRKAKVNLTQCGYHLKCQKEYQNTPEAKVKRKEYRSTPEYKAKKRKYQREYYRLQKLKGDKK